MGIRERKEKAKKELKLRILNAASQMIINDGFENFSVRKLADVIEYSPTTIYLYFKNKADLLIELGKAGDSEYYRRVNNISSKTKKLPVAYLKEIIKIISYLAIENPNIYRIRNTRQIAAKKSKILEKGGMAQVPSRKYSDVFQCIKQCVEEGVFEPVDVEIAAISLISAIQGMISMVIENPELPKKRISKIVDSVTEIQIRGLMKQG
ncbi:MAG: TetR/AcrR family transcriptional regulator [Desulfobacteraceae bacterium]|nr:TetR/AcrR family transcriptional regulator [Desulfobacteraceae bacterium]